MTRKLLTVDWVTPAVTWAGGESVHQYLSILSICQWVREQGVGAGERCCDVEMVPGVTGDKEEDWRTWPHHHTPALL